MDLDTILALSDEALSGTPQAPGAGVPIPGERPPIEGPVGPKPGIEPGLRDPTAPVLDAAVGGAARAVLETGDFVSGLVGGPSQIGGEERERFETQMRSLTDESVTAGFVGALSQFATGMVGLGKLQAATGLAANAGRVTKAGVEIAKAATVGAIAFDPYEERLSNLVERFPSLSNFATRWLAANPEDTEAEGRFKAALESIGLDLAVVGVFAAGAKLVKAMKGGDQKAIQKATDELSASMDNYNASQAEVEAPAPAPAQAATEPQAVQLQDGVQPDDAYLAATGQRPVTQNDPNTGLPRDSLPEDLPTPANDNPPPAAQVSQGGTLQGTPRTQLAPVSDEELKAIVQGAAKDAEALVVHGGWDAAISVGHTFGKGRVPWQKLTERGDPVTELDAFVARVAETLKPQLDTIKGGDVLKDRTVSRMVHNRAALFDENPAEVVGLIQRAGQNASTMAANMEAGYLLAQRAMLDTYSMASRINAGYLDEWGGDITKAYADLKSMMRTSATLYGSARSMTAAAGRSLRRMRGEFAIKAGDILALDAMDPKMLAKTLADTGGNPQAIRRVVQPTVWSRMGDGLAWLHMNNLLWGWKTHAINLTTNAYQVFFRPLERAIGSFGVGGDAGQRIRAEAFQQYAYILSSIPDAFLTAMRTWKMADSVLHPHGGGFEASNRSMSIGTQVARAEFKPMTTPSNILHNAMIGVAKTLGTPTRALGVVDETVKQVVYRSKVQAKAAVEAAENGLQGADFAAYVRKRLSDAFDDSGRGVDLEALREAQIATFQQELLPGTLGRWMQGAHNHTAMRLVVPFIRTPTNVIRQGIKMTPGLNMLQREYRDMIAGRLGAEAQAQAVGQMAMGTLFLSTAGVLAASGMITGGGPSDPRARRALMDTGWRPYHFILPNSDGSRTYVEYGRFDPLAMPLGIVADLTDVIGQLDEDDPNKSKMEAALTGLALAMAKQLGNKTYLMSISQAVEAFLDPDRSMGRYAGTMMANLLPAASAMRNYNFADPLMRDARDMVDKVKATIPGLSETVPARYDVWGEPVYNNRGLWITGDRDIVDAEVRRMIEEAGVELGAPSPNVGDGVDLRELTLQDGRNAYEVYQQKAGKPTPRTTPLKDRVAQVMKTEAYRRAPDGDIGTRGTKLWLISGVIKRYREVALRQIKADPVVREALLRKRMEVRAAYAAQRDPGRTVAVEERRRLKELGARFGVDLQSVVEPR